MKMALSRLEAEKRALQEELGRTESRSAKLELQRMSTEGDLQRLQMMLQEKDATIQVGFIARSALVSYLVFAEIAGKV
jgi:rootletin